MDVWGNIVSRWFKIMLWNYKLGNAEKLWMIMDGGKCF